VDETLAERLTSVGALVEPARRALYLHVAAQQEPVSREQAAAAVGLPLHSAKFHLDRLVAEGLLDTEFRRLSGRSGPGAGRPAKLYRRSPRQVSVSLPERRYDVAGDVLASAITASMRHDVPVEEALHCAAREHGRSMAAAAGTVAEPPAHPQEQADSVLAVLTAAGYEPRPEGTDVVLVNCPFHRLAQDHTELVCGMNLTLLTSALDAMGCRTLQARLEPEPPLCCVRLRRRA
jgi:predicted ArsR family transcriptional regulator